MPLIKDLIHIPERVHRGDFVLNLIEGMQDDAAERTVQDYVVTEQLAAAFADALNLLRSVYAAPGGRSKATYLHGSFGAGKSHFMAILGLLLNQHPAVQRLPRLQPVIQQHRSWLDGRRFLVVPLHLLNAESLEAGILGGYAHYIARRHPEAPPPAFYPADEVLGNAEHLRQVMGDDAFFAALNRSTASGGRWGDLEVAWTPEAYDAARREGPQGERGRQLVAAVVQQLLPAARNTSAFVPLADGLVELSRHAQGLGYQGVVLFLDELVLWLLSRAADPQFVGREGAKIAALVEGRIAEAPLPIVSFVARQRDLREALGDSLTGAAHQAMSNAMTWWEERFHIITLEDRNLPLIVEERLLKPRDQRARALIDEAFNRVFDRANPAAQEAWLTAGGTREEFRRLYPFSPALVQVLVAVSGALQRERTALRILLQMLCEQRERLELGQLVPLGDLWDAIAAGEEVFAPQLRKVLDDARRLWEQTLRPLILAELKLPDSFDPLTAADAQQAQAYQLRARVAKTLLLTAIAPGVESLRQLTAARLAALNQVRLPASIVPNQEPRVVLRWIKEWQQHCGQIKLTGDEDHPVIRLELTDVDTEVILQQARGEDNAGNRRRLILQLLCQQFGIELPDQGRISYSVTWRGCEHQVELRFLNVREARPEQLKGPGDRWLVVIDYPFDEPGKTPADDVAVLNDFRQREPLGTRTLVWLPEFFSADIARSLGRLVIIEFVLQGDRLDRYTGHLNERERAQARAQLDNRRTALQRQLITALETAYGLHAEAPTAIERYFQGPSDQLVSLMPGLRLQPSDRSTLREALQSLIAQALAHQFPAHPEFTQSVTKSALRVIARYAEQACADPNHRTEQVESQHRSIMQGIAVPLGLGTANERVFHFGRTWIEHFQRCMAQEGVHQPTVKQLRDWCDLPQPRGLTPEVADLVIWMFARQTDRRFYLRGAPVEVTFDRLEPAMELRAQPLPDHALWQQALERAAQAFGHAGTRTLNAAAVQQLVAAVRRWQEQHLSAAKDLPTALRQLAQELTVSEPFPRLVVADAALRWLQALQRAADEQVVDTFARTQLAAEVPAIARSLATAKSVCDAITTHRWNVLLQLASLPGPGQARASELLDELREHLRRPQHEFDLAASITQVSAKVTQLCQSLRNTSPPATPSASEAQRQQLEAERQQLERERAELERQRRELAERQRREELERQQREQGQRAAEATRARETAPAAEAVQPIEIEVQRVEAALSTLREQIAALARTNPGKRLRIVIEVVEP